MSKAILSYNEKETTALAKKIAKQLHPGDIICLDGELGSGKTTFIKGIAQGLGIDPTHVHSPTFVLINIYEGKYSLHHYDLYRLENEAQIEGIGFTDLAYGKAVSVIEWAKKLNTLKPKEYMQINLEHVKESQRKITISFVGESFQKRSSRFKGIL